MRKATLCYDLNECERHCVATRNAVTASPCVHGYTWYCPHAAEQYAFVTRSPAAATAMGKADISGEAPYVPGAGDPYYGGE